MVTEFGMSDKLGPLSFGKRDELVFLGREIGEQRNYSDEVAKTIDEEVRAIIDKAYERATEVLTTHRDKLIALAEKLVAEETVDSDGFEALFSDLPPKEDLHGIPTIVGPGQPVAGAEPPAGLTAGATSADEDERAGDGPLVSILRPARAAAARTVLSGLQPSGCKTRTAGPAHGVAGAMRRQHRVGATAGGSSPSAVSRFRQTAANTPMTGPRGTSRGRRRAPRRRGWPGGRSPGGC